MISEFGKGCVYCLGLFLAHSERDMWGGNSKYEKESDERFAKLGTVEGYSHTAEMWFNSASDHLYDLEIPTDFPNNIKNRLKKLQEKSIEFGHGFKNNATKKDKQWSVNEAKELLMLIDKLLGIKPVRAEFQ